MSKNHDALKLSPTVSGDNGMSLEELWWSNSTNDIDEITIKSSDKSYNSCIEWHSGEDLGDDEQDEDPLLRCDNLESYEGIKPGSHNNG